MSKLEDALKKAQENRGKSLVQLGTSEAAATESSGTALEPVNGRRGLVDIEARAESAKQIALMEERDLLSPKELEARKIIHGEMHSDKIANTFRELRTRIMQKCNGSDRVIMVTAPSYGCGTSFVSVNLASAFSFDESKTSLLVDCNLHDHGLSKLLPGGDGDGLTDYLDSPDMDIADVIHSTGIKRLRVLPAGGERESPGEYFTSFKMKELMVTVKERYPDRFIILDSPPVMESADTHILSELCDHIILVVPYSRFTKAQLETTIQGMDREKILGVIFNDEPSTPSHSWRKLLKDILPPLFKHSKSR